MDLTIKEYAAEWRVSVRTVRNWMDKGAITFIRTPGGQIRIPNPRGSRIVILQNEESSGNTST